MKLSVGVIQRLPDDGRGEAVKLRFCAQRPSTRLSLVNGERPPPSLPRTYVRVFFSYLGCVTTRPDRGGVLIGCLSLPSLPPGACVGSISWACRGEFRGSVLHPVDGGASLLWCAAPLQTEPGGACEVWTALVGVHLVPRRGATAE